MTVVQGDMFEPHVPTLEEAIEAGNEGMARAAQAADAAWTAAAERYIESMPLGRLFIGEDVVIAVEEAGHRTTNRKAIGPVINRAARARLIAKTGQARPARTSHGSLKPEWTRR